MLSRFSTLGIGAKPLLSRVGGRVKNAERVEVMSKRMKLAEIAELEAKKFYHGFVMETEPNIQPIINLFPEWPLKEWDAKWCAAFVYSCCILAGFKLPVRYPHETVTCNFAGCFAWEQWAVLPCNGFLHKPDDAAFVPEPGDIVLYDNVFMNVPHDHIGVILENRKDTLVVAEGNFNNVSAVVERKKDEHIRAYIRIPEDYSTIVI